MVLHHADKVNRFVSMFDTTSGHYMRTGVLDEKGKDTGVDPFMTIFPELLDVGIMGHCAHGEGGLCLRSGVQCYQDGLHIYEDNMSLENFKKIVDECKGWTYQIALGGRGDPNMHENFEEILKYCRDNDIVPNFTTSGLGLTADMADLCKEYCGAVAVSWYDQLHTFSAIDMLVTAGVKTNIHYVLSKRSIRQAIDHLTNNSFRPGINAVIFLLHKPVGLGSENIMLSKDNPDLIEFFKLIDENKFPFKIGFDSCTVPGIINMCKSIDPTSIDTCEGGRWSAYISADMKMLPCSFDNQDMRWAYDISEDTIQNAWNSPQFEDFRNHFRHSCPDCKCREACMGGCPIKPQVVLCDREEKNRPS